MRVLVVDGSAAVSVRLAARLREASHDVIGMAGSAVAALDLALVLRPDVIVIDPQLPDRSGPEVVTALKKHAPAAVVVVLSSDPQPRYRSTCLAHGADFFFDKASELEAVVTALMPRSSR